MQNKKLAEAKKKRKSHSSIKEWFRNEDGAVDLGSIMVGIIVIGLIGGVIAATVFAVIPWSQDNAAKQQLGSIAQAENAYMGLASSTPPPAGVAPNSFADSAALQSTNLFGGSTNTCVITTDSGKSFTAFAKSATGKFFTVTDKNSAAVQYTASLPSGCQYLGPYVDPTPTLTVMTYRCDVNTTATIPMRTNQKGTETWSDGVTRAYAGGEALVSRTLTAGVNYTLTFDGTYETLKHDYALARCLRTVNHWGAGTGVKSASQAFSDSTYLNEVPANIPSTITNMAYMFYGATAFNDPDVSNWKTSNVTNMQSMFRSTAAFNQPIENWDVSKVTNMASMFDSAKFNQPLNNWNTSNVTSLYGMFFNNPVFNQPLNKWDTSKVTTLQITFNGATAFNGDISTWKTDAVTNMSSTFQEAASFNQPIGSWNTSLVTDMSQMFLNAKTFNQPLNTWNTSNVLYLQGMFNGATVFNQPLNNWTTNKVTYMFNMFINDPAFNQNISNWSTSSMTVGTNFADAATFNAAYKPAGTTLQ